MIVASCILIGLTVAMIARGWDVRFGLLSCAIAIGVMAGNVRPVVQEFFSTLCNEKFVIPICCAMGFAHSLRYVQCDRHLVWLLTKPLRRVRSLLLPGVVLVGFIVNIPVISQTSTAVCIGAVVVPLLRAAGYSPVSIGSTLVLGSSIGGELLNPGAPELITVAKSLDIESKQIIPSILHLIVPQLFIALGLFWCLRLREERRLMSAKPEPIGNDSHEPIDRLKAAIPFLPLLFLLASGPPLYWIHIPKDWLIPQDWIGDKEKSKIFDARLIGVAMIGGSIIAGLAGRSQWRGVPKAFFEGAGYAFAEIVSLIVAAQSFGKAIELAGFKAFLQELILNNESLLLPLSAGLPGAFAFISGSGMAATSSLYEIFVEPSRHLGHDPREVGALVSLASAAGRTMSPFAAVVLMSAKMTGTTPFQLVRRVMAPLIAGLVSIVVLRSLRII